jgi:hypothetical protein
LGRDRVTCDTHEIFTRMGVMPHDTCQQTGVLAATWPQWLRVKLRRTTLALRPLEVNLTKKKFQVAPESANFIARLASIEVTKASDRYEPTAAATRLVRTTLPPCAGIIGNESYQLELPIPAGLVESRQHDNGLLSIRKT